MTFVIHYHRKGGVDRAILRYGTNNHKDGDLSFDLYNAVYVGRSSMMTFETRLGKFNQLNQK